MAEASGERIYRGTAVTGGIAVGPLVRLPAVGEGLEAAVRSLPEAIEVAAAEIGALIERSDDDGGDILAFQLALLEDEDLIDPIRAEIDAGAAPGDAWRTALDREIAAYRADGDGTLAARAEDLADLRDRVLRALAGAKGAEAALPDGAILLAEELSPSAFLSLDWNRLAGAVSQGGSSTSHVAILARARGVPLMVGVEPVTGPLPEAPAVLDLSVGRLTVAPTPETLDAARAAVAAGGEDAAALRAHASRPARTADGTPIAVMANIDDPAILETLPVEHTDGIGLTRTEFLFARGAPDEETQLAFYRRLVAWAGGKPVTIRTLDAGGDKPLPGITIDGEANPFLGVRGVRLSLRRPDLFRVQLRALLRAAAEGEIKVMIPMVTAPHELEAVRDLMAAEKEALDRAGVACAMPALGIMVEVPTAALSAAAFDAEFYSIGSNDLIQYATASARDNPAVSELADPAAPAVLQLIRATVEASHARGKPVSLCGDMASSPDRVPTLLGQGLRALSCAPAQIGAVKRAVAETVLG